MARLGLHDRNIALACNRFFLKKERLCHMRLLLTLIIFRIRKRLQFCLEFDKKILNAGFILDKHLVVCKSTKNEACHVTCDFIA